MKPSKSIRSKGALAALAFVVASAIPGSATVLHVPADYSTIQAAVDAAASGDEIQIGPGVYTNQVVIAYKNLTLSGSPGAILRATPNMESTLALYTGAIRQVALLGIFKSTNVVSGLTFEGERLADSQPGGYIGIWFLAAGGGVEDCRLTGFRGKAIDTTNGGFAVKVGNPNYGFGQVDVQVLRNTFADNAVSIGLAGDEPPPNGSWHPELLKTTFTVNDNLIAGNGPDDTGAQFGIWIATGAKGEVKRNTITDFSYTGTYSDYNNSPNAEGLLANDPGDFGGTNLQALQPLTFEGNIFRNNQIDMVLMRADGSTITNNSFEGAAPGLVRGGLGFSGDHVQVANNRFSDMDTKTGIVLFGGDPAYGPNLGIATHATLTANGFCHVTTNYDFGPLATYDLLSTLPPCTGPVLDTTRSVLLSWPYCYNGYSLETATNMNGPWTTSDATVFQQDGRNNVAVPADKPQQIYRLVKP